MNRQLRRFLSMTLLVWAIGAPASAAPRTAADIVALGSASDGQIVEFTGEAIGEALRAGKDEVWVNILSGEVALGVVISSRDAAAITEFGRYQRLGATVRVEGVYHVGCDTHGGEVDVHATRVQVVAPGRTVPERVAFWQLGVAAGLFAITAMSAVRYSRSRRKYASG